MRVRILSLILVLSLALLQLPSSAFAGGGEEYPVETEAFVQETLPAEADEPAPAEETENGAAAEDLPAEDPVPAQPDGEENADPEEDLPPEVSEMPSEGEPDNEPTSEDEPDEAVETSDAIEGQTANAASDSVLSSTAAKHIQDTSPDGYFELLIEADKDVARPGEMITYTVTVRNSRSRSRDVLDFVVNDYVTTPLEKTGIAKGESFSFTRTYVATEADLNEGNVRYRVTVTAYGPDSDDPIDGNPKPLVLSIDILPDPNNCTHTDANKDGRCDACRGEFCTVELTSDGGNGTSVAHLTGGSAGKAVVGQRVTISASPVDGYEFCGWYNGDTLVGSNLTCEVTLTSPLTKLTARFVPAASLQLEVSANGYFKVQDALQLDNYVRRLPAGETVTVSYQGEGFLYWVNGSQKIMSRNANYTFTLVTDTSLHAVTAKGLSDGDLHYAVVIFESEFGQVMQSSTWCSGNMEDHTTLPLGPSKLGYTFRYWALEGTTEQATPKSICAAIVEGTSALVLKPVYAANEGRYTVTAVPVVDRAVQKDYAARNEGLRLGQSLFLRLPLESTETLSFLYWAADEEGKTILSYATAYYFQVNGDQTVYAIYRTATETPDAQPTIALTGYTAFTDGAQHKVSYSISRSVPEGWTLLQHGALYSVSKSAAETMILGAEDVKQTTSSDLLANGIYTLNIGVTGKESTSIAVRGYLVVKNEATDEQQTLYTEVCTGSWSSLSAKAAAG